MLGSYLIITLRNLLRHKTFTFINTLGLAVGIGSFTVLMLLVLHETTYDVQHFNSRRIFRVTQEIKKNNVGERSASLPFPVADQLKKDYPDLIAETVRFFNMQSPAIPVGYKGEYHYEKRFFFVDSTFFKVFRFYLEKGNTKTALALPNSLVISKKIARKYFGDEEPIGKKLTIMVGHEFTVTGVLEESNFRSHLEFDMLASFHSLNEMYKMPVQENWIWNPCWTYVVLHKANMKDELRKQLPFFVVKYFPDALKDFVSLNLQAINDIHLHSNLAYEISINSDIEYVHIFLGMACFLLAIASLNFINIATARSSLRTKEVLVRKIIGANKSELFWQFLFENFLISLFAILLAFVLVEISVPFLSDLSGNPLSKWITNDWNIAAWLGACGLVIGVLSSIYPAFYLANFNASKNFKSAVSFGKSGTWFRQGLVVLQFMISIFMLISTLVSYDQLRFLRQAKLGFDKEQIIVLPIAFTKILYRYDDFKKELLGCPSISSITAMETIIGREHQTHEYAMPYNPDEFTFFPSILVKHDFIKTFNIKLLAGKDFESIKIFKNDGSVYYDYPESYSTDSLTQSGAVIINQAMLKHLGYTKAQDALNQTLISHAGKERIIGVVDNFHFTSLHDTVSPFILNLAKDERRMRLVKYMAVRTQRNRTFEALEYIARTWPEFTAVPFEYFFLHENLDQLYNKEQKLSEISAIFAGIAVFIATMGMFSLTSFVVAQRRREIGIRKSLGSSASALVFLLSKDFMKLAMLSILIACPIAYLGVWTWLGHFPNHVELKLSNFLLASGVILGVTLITVSLHTLRTVLQTPVAAINQQG